MPEHEHDAPTGAPDFDGTRVGDLLIAPTSPITLPADTPAWLRPYHGPGTAWLPGSLLFYGAVRAAARSADGRPLDALDQWDDIPRIQDAYCRAALAMLASTGHTEDLTVNQRIWCGLPLFGGYVAALAVQRTWADHPDVQDDYLLNEHLTGVIRAVWPTPRSVAAPSGDTLHLALGLHRHLNAWYGAGGPVQRHDVNRAVDDVYRVGAATAGQQRQVALWHLTRNAFGAVRTITSRGRYVVEALVDALPDPDGEQQA